VQKAVREKEGELRKLKEKLEKLEREMKRGTELSESEVENLKEQYK